MSAITNFFNGIFDKDQHLFDNLEEGQKKAFCRLMKEMSQADGITLKEEFSKAPHFPMTYMANCTDITYEEAIEMLKSIGQSKSDRIIDVLEQMSQADGVYTNEERDLLTKIRKDFR